METHLFIIWSNAKYMENKILKDISTHFEIIGKHKISWNKNNFSRNLTRFYGENLPKNSNKEKLCGNDPFLLVVIRDHNPLYRNRMTSKGLMSVNVNIFDAKEMYRSWTGGGHMIHGTNNLSEVKHDLILLTGLSVEDYLKKFENNQSILRDEYKYLIGEKSWKDANELLYVMNETINYVILRNFDGIFSEVNRGIHGDVDILVDNFYKAQLILNAIPTHKSKKRVQHIVKIGEGGIYFDIRYISDNYYCKQWEKKLLETKYFNSKGYYRPNEYNYKFSLLYHALVQKKFISPDYMEQFNILFPKISKDPYHFLKIELNNFMIENQYSFVEPDDYSVYFNKSITKKRMSAKKFLLKMLHKFFDR